jgi:hypothetical protein
MPTLVFPDGSHNPSRLPCLEDGHDLIGLGTPEVAIYEIIAPTWGILLNGHTPFLGTVRSPVVVLTGDIAQDLPAYRIDLAIGPEEANRALFLLKRLDRRIQQDAIETAISKTDVILVVFVEGVHGNLQRGEIPGEYLSGRLSFVGACASEDIKGEALA